MKKIILFTFVLLLSASLLACSSGRDAAQQEEELQTEETMQQADEADKTAIVDLVISFGSKLQKVSLQAPKDILEKSMKENYSEYVAQGLIEKWINDPLNAPGRLTSSPWPDRIEIVDIKKAEKDTYEVKGKIIEITSAEQASGGAAAKRPITLTVRKTDNRWLITAVTLGEYEAAGLKAYFPLTKGSTWQYKGEGNEYASFRRQVLFVEGDRAQIADDNGGTVSASIFKTTEEAITRTFFQGEEYEKENLLKEQANDNTVILKAPLKTGTKWETAKDTREIVDTNAAVETPAGIFEGCIKVSIKTQNSNMYEYYKVGVGMVKREFISEGITVTSALEKYDIK